MAKVSIVVPVYNVEKYLVKCLDSIANQTLEDIEIVCVDDGSTDNSAAILDEYADKDARFIVIHKENAGYGHSMNVGIARATGEYIGIVESDDYVLPQMYEVLYVKAKENDLDLIKSECTYFWESMGQTKRIHYKNMDGQFNKVLRPEDRKWMFQFYMNTWSGIYKKSFLEQNNILHNETPGAAYQDNGFWMQTMAMCKRAMWLNQAYYMYRQDNPQASVKSQEKALAMYNEYNRVDEIFTKKGLEYELKISHHIRMMRHRGTFFRIGNELKREYVCVMMQDYKQYRDELYRFDFWPQQVSVLNFFERFYVDEEKEVQRLISVREDIDKLLEKNQSIILYGAGAYAHSLCEKLFALGMLGKISAICQTIVSEEKTIFGKSVCALYELQDISKSLIIVCVRESGKAFEEMESILKEKGLNNYTGCEKFINNIYSV